MKEHSPIIHVGYHKTASTYLQKYIFPQFNMEQIILPSVEYISKSKTFDPKVFLKQIKIRNKFSIISQENFVGYPETTSGRNGFIIANRLKDTFPNAKIIIVIRNQIEYLKSLYTFRVIKRGIEISDFNTYFKKNRRFSKKLNYYKMIKHYQELFGTKNVLVKIYEELNEDKQKFISDIKDFANIKNEIIVKDIVENRGNKSKIAITFNRLLNIPMNIFEKILISIGVVKKLEFSRLSNIFFKLKKYTLNQILKLCKGEFVIRNEKQISEVFRKCNQKLEKLLKIDLKKYNYPT